MRFKNHFFARAFFVLLPFFLLPAANLLAQAPEFAWATNEHSERSKWLAEKATGIATDAAGNSYIIGEFSGSIVFGNTTIHGQGGPNIFVAKYNASGNVLWAKSAKITTLSTSGSFSQNGNSIAVDNNGNCYITGSFIGQITFDSIVINNTVPFSNGGHDMFVAKYDSSGNVLWAKKAGGVNDDRGRGIAADNNGNCYVTGSYSYADFGSLNLWGNGCFLAKYDASGNEVWVKSGGGNSGEGYGIALDSDNNSYITGSFVTIGSFDAISISGSGQKDVFVAKYDSLGNALWAVAEGGTNNEEGRGIAVDGSGNPYVTGLFYGTAVFGTTSLVTTGATSSSDAFVARYDTGGNLIWARKAGGYGYDEGHGIAIDNLGNSYFTGKSGSFYFGSTLVGSGAFFASFDASGNPVWGKKNGNSSSDIGAGVALDASGNCYLAGSFNDSGLFGNITLGGYDWDQNAFVAKCSSAGTIIWAKSPYASYSSISGNLLAIDTNGNTYVGGIFEGTAIIGTDTLINSNGSSGSGIWFLVKYDAAGNVLWARKITGVIADMVTDQNNNLIIAGTFTGDITFGTNTFYSGFYSDIFLVKYNSNGAVLWARQDGGTGNETVKGLALDSIGNAYITGIFESSTTIGTFTLTATGYSDIFTAKYDTAGIVVWARKDGGANSAGVQDIAVDKAGNCFITGHFYSSGLIGNTTLTSVGDQDIYLAKFDAAGNPLWAKRGGSTWPDYPTGVSVDSSGNSYIVGTFGSNATFAPFSLSVAGGMSGDINVYLVKYDNAGTVLWAKKAKGAVTKLTTDSNGISYLTGYFTNTAVFGTTTITAGYGTDMFLTSYDATGNVSWIKQADGMGGRRSNYVALDSEENPYITGALSLTNIFDSTTIVTGGGNMFLAKLNANYSSIATTVSPLSFCPGAAVDVSFTATGYGYGAFTGSTTFTAQLSDTVGNFDNPVSLGSVTGLNLGTINGAIPALTVSGIGYRIRVIAASPAVTGADNGTDISISTPPAITINAPVTTICVGQSTQLSASGYAGYNWNTSQTDSIISVSPVASTNYIVTGMAANGCLATGNIAITVNPVPVVSVSNDTTICAGATVSLTATGADIYTWMPVNLVSSTASVIPAFTTTYSVNGDFITGCSDTATVTITVLPSIVPFSALAAPDSLAPSDLLTLFIPNPDTGLTYTWSGPDLNQTTGDTATANPTTNGTVTYTVTASNGTCTETATVSVVIDPSFIIQTQGWNWAIGGGSGSGTLTNGSQQNNHNNSGRILISGGESGIDIAAHSTGRTATIGSFKGTATFGSSTLVAQGEEDMVIFLTSNLGNVAWAKRAGSSGMEKAKAIGMDLGGNGYITGSFSGIANFDGFNLTSTGTEDAFIAKYIVIDGGVTWAKRAGGTGVTSATDIVTDGLGNSTVVGFFSGSTNFDTHSLTSNGNKDIFVARYNFYGYEIWAKNFGGTSEDEAYSVSIDNAGNIYLTGTFQGSINFGSVSLTSLSNRSKFMAKLDNSGNVVWAKVTGTASSSDDADRIAVSNNQIFTAGNFFGTISFGTTTLTSTGNTDLFIAAYSTDGNIIWARKAGGAGDDIATGITTDAEGNIYLTGSYTAGISFGEHRLHNIGAEDVFVAKYSPNGTPLWARKAGGIGADAGMAIAVDDQGNSYTTGYFSGSATFGDDELFSNGAQDMFVARLGHIAAAGTGDAFSSKGNINVYPNPFSNNFSVTFTSTDNKVELMLTDIIGRAIFSKTYQIESGETTLQIQPESQLLQGVYTLQLKQNDQTQTIRIVKQ